MSKAAAVTANPPAEEEIDLKDPVVAAALGWLIPGLGHLYQGRTSKGLLFMICILGTFFYGMFLSDGRAVYAAWVDWDPHYPYICQVGVGAPALPALLQTYLVRHGKAPLMGGIMAPPASQDELNEWHRSLHHYFELGTVYTMIAGLLNILAIYDAWGGPVQIVQEEQQKKQPDDEDDPSSA